MKEDRGRKMITGRRKKGKRQKNDDGEIERGDN